MLGFTAFGVEAAEIMTSVQIAMNVGLPYTALRDAIATQPTLVEGLTPLFSSAPSMLNELENEQAAVLERGGASNWIISPCGLREARID
jgi:hypothetical protein